MLRALAITVLSLSLLHPGAVGAAASGKAFGWGDGGAGELGHGSTDSEYEPNPISGLRGVVQVVGGDGFAVALRNDGTVWAWGYNGSGSLGNGTASDSYTPVSVANLTNVKSIAVGSFHVLAIKKNGTLWGWGLNGGGQLAMDPNETSYTPVPVRIEGLSGVKAASAGYNFSVAVMEDGSVKTWGQDSDGALGNGSDGETFVPTTISGVQNVRSVSSSMIGTHTLALLENGTVRAWGYNTYGQLGDGSYDPTDVPVRVEDLTGVKAVSTGYTHSLALKTNGKVRGWGDGTQGQLGPDESDTNVPVPIPGLGTVTAIASGYAHNLALRDNGTIIGWGLNEWAQASGDGEASLRADPVVVPSFTGITRIGAGENVSYAVK